MVAAKAERKAGEFLSDAALEATGEFRKGRARRPEYRLVEPVVFELGGKGSGTALIVPAGYITDGYSMPGRLLQMFQPHGARWLLPSILHDWLYDAGLVPRAFADRVLLHAMRAVGVSKARSFLVYWAVRLGGWGGFNRPYARNLDVVALARQLDVPAAVIAYLKTERGETNV